MLQIKVAGKFKSTHFMFNNFFFENRAVYKIMSKNYVELERVQITILTRRVRFAC